MRIKIKESEFAEFLKDNPQNQEAVQLSSEDHGYYYAKLKKRVIEKVHTVDIKALEKGRKVNKERIAVELEELQKEDYKMAF